MAAEDEYKRVQEKNIRKFYLALRGMPLLLTIPELSTITVQGKLSGVCFLESELIHELAVPLDNYIMYINCNYGEIYNPNFPEFKERREHIKNMKKPAKKKCKRRVQGRGTSLSSQITFHIRANLNTNLNTNLNAKPANIKYYQVHLFRNGAFTIPGIINYNMRELFEVIPKLIAYLKSNKIFSECDIHMENHKANMTNYKSRLFNLNYHVNLEMLETIIKQFKQIDLNSVNLEDKIDIKNLKHVQYEKDFPETNGRIDEEATRVILEDVVVRNINQEVAAEQKIDAASTPGVDPGVDPGVNMGVDPGVAPAASTSPDASSTRNSMGINTVRCNVEKGSSLVVKSLKDKSRSREITLKILKKGKVNFDGANTKLDVLESFLWLHYIYYTNFNQVLCNIKLIENVSPDTSDCDEKSMYDSHDDTRDRNKSIKCATARKKRTTVYGSDEEYIPTRDVILRIRERASITRNTTRGIVRDLICDIITRAVNDAREHSDE